MRVGVLDMLVHVLTCIIGLLSWRKLNNVVNAIVLFLFCSASDATQIFEETKHSLEAREMMQAFFVGIFVEVSGRRN